jgi:hypothetical protein
MGGQQEAKKRPLPWSDESVYEGCDCPRGCCWCGLLVGQGGVTLSLGGNVEKERHASSGRKATRGCLSDSH